MNLNKIMKLFAVSCVMVFCMKTYSFAKSEFVVEREPSAVGVEAREDQGELTLTIRRTGDLSQDVRMHYFTQDLPPNNQRVAEGGRDYFHTKGSLYWPANDSSKKTISVGINNDFVKNEGNEYFWIYLTDEEDVPKFSSDLTLFTINVAPVLARIEDSPEDTLTGDFDLDGKVGFSDFILLSSHFGKNAYSALLDIDGRNGVDFADFVIFSQNFGNSH